MATSCGICSRDLTNPVSMRRQDEAERAHVRQVEMELDG
jgi:hypothetical protein